MKILELLKAKSEDHFGYEGITIAVLGDSVTQGCFAVYTKLDGQIEAVYDQLTSYVIYVFQIFLPMYPQATVHLIHA